MTSFKNNTLEAAFRSLIRYRLLLPILIAAISTMTTVSYFTGRVLQKQQERFNASISHTTQIFIALSAQELDAIAVAIPDISLDTTQEFMEAQWKTHGSFDTIYLISTSGIIQAIAPMDKRYLGFDMSRQDYYLSLNCTEEINISSTFSSLRTGDPTVYISRCAADGRLLVGELNLSTLQETTSMGASQFPEVVVLVVDQNGTLIAHPDFNQVERQNNISHWKIVQTGFQDQRSMGYYWREGRFWFGTTEKVEPIGWLIITEVPFWVVYGPALSASTAMIAFLILISSVAVQRFSKRVHQQVVQPLKRLSISTDALAAGDYSISHTIPRDSYSLSEIRHLIANFQNMSETISSREKLLRESEKQYRGLVENSPDAIIVHNQHQIVYVNDAARKLYKTEHDAQIIGIPLLALIHPVSQPMAAMRFKSIHDNKERSVLPLAEQKHVRFDGAVFDAETLTSSIFFEGRYEAQTIIRDISRRKDEEERLKYLASHDFLTDLPNRFFFEEVLQHTIAKIKRTNMTGAVLYLDIDQFKGINDTYGHAVGDVVLKEIAAKLRATVREEDIIARIGGDEFVILLDSIKDAANAAQVAQAVLNACSKPIHLEHRRMSISFSIGIAIFPKDGVDAQELLQMADAAMYKAKDEGKNRAKFYSSEMRKKTEDRIQIISYLQYALEKDEFYLVYQPQFAVKDGRCIGAEVLLRWQHPKLGTLNPGRFIEMAEETGLILPIGEWVLRKACEQSKDWQDIAPHDFHIAINLSNLQLKQPNLLDKLAEILKTTGANPSNLEIELLENVVFENPESAIERLFKLKSLGVKLAIDDFGTGYSMLGYLARFPFDHIKIDQRLAPNILVEPKEAAIVSGIIAISRELGLTVIAEGIETQEQLDFYQSLGCNYFQGWYYSKAVDANTITALLKNGCHL